MIDDNDFKNIFNNSSLKNEDWLQPADATYDRISKEIAKKKKRRFALWLWFGAGMLVLVFVVTGWYSRQRNLQDTLATIENNKIENLADQNNSHYQESSGSQAEEASSNIEDFNLDKKEIQEATINKYSSSNFGQKTNRNLNRSTAPGVINFISKSDLTSFAERQVKFGENGNLESNEKVNVVLSKELNIKFKRLAELEIIPSIDLSILPSWSRNKYKPSLLAFEQESPRFGNAFFFNIGYSNWNFNLNEDFNSAVSPADFRKTNGQGFAASFGYARKLGKRFQVGASLQYERVTLESGHNSAFTYDVDEEIMEGENRTDLSMATPLGFVSSPVVVSRLSAGTTSTMYDLTLDLSNRHILQNLDIGIDMNYDFFSFSGFRASALAGFGWNRILNVKNELFKITTGDGNFSAEGSELVSDQANLQSNRMYYALGLNLKRNVTEKSQLWLSYSYKKDFNSIFKLDALSTTLIRHNLQLGLVRQF